MDNYYDIDDCEPKITYYNNGYEEFTECSCDDCEHKEECDKWT